MLEKIQTIQHHTITQQLRDVRVLGFLVFGIMVLLVSWSGVGVIESNFELEKQVAKLEQQNKVSQLENENQKLQNQYLATDEYIDMTARKQFGKALPGETLLIVPERVALANTLDLEPQKVAEAKTATNKPTYQKNLEAWRDFLTHKPIDAE